MAAPAVKLKPDQDLGTRSEAHEVGYLVAPLVSKAALVDPAAAVLREPALLRVAYCIDWFSGRQQHFELVSLSKLTDRRYQLQHTAPQSPHLAAPQALLWAFPVEAESRAALEL